MRLRVEKKASKSSRDAYGVNFMHHALEAHISLSCGWARLENLNIFLLELAWQNSMELVLNIRCPILSFGFSLLTTKWHRFYSILMNARIRQMQLTITEFSVNFQRFNQFQLTESKSFESLYGEKSLLFTWFDRWLCFKRTIAVAFFVQDNHSQPKYPKYCDWPFSQAISIWVNRWTIHHSNQFLLWNRMQQFNRNIG